MKEFEFFYKGYCGKCEILGREDDTETRLFDYIASLENWQKLEILRIHDIQEMIAKIKNNTIKYSAEPEDALRYDPDDPYLIQDVLDHSYMIQVAKKLVEILREKKITVAEGMNLLEPCEQEFLKEYTFTGCNSKIENLLPELERKTYMLSEYETYIADGYTVWQKYIPFDGLLYSYTVPYASVMDKIRPYADAWEKIFARQSEAVQGAGIWTRVRLALKKIFNRSGAAYELCGNS